MSLSLPGRLPNHAATLARLACIAAVCGAMFSPESLVRASADDPTAQENPPALAQVPKFTSASNSAAPSLEDLKGDIDLFRQHITTLSNPFFEGRAPGTRGNRLAAEYIEFYAKSLKLLPAFDTEEKDADGNVTSTKPRSNFRQVFTAPASQRPGDSVKLSEQIVAYEAKDGRIVLKPDADFKVIGFSGSGDINGPLAFAGYALRNDEKEYDTFFEKPSLEGKVAIIFRFEPVNDQGKSLWSEAGWSPSAALDAKLRATEKAGAAAIILVSPPGADDDRTNKLEGLELSSGTRGNKVPVIMMSISAADALVKAADKEGRSLMDLRKAADTLAQNTAGVIDLPNARVAINVKLDRIPLLTDNVGAILPGKGKLADEFVVIGSHYDHVGYGYFGSRDANGRGKIHPGADDNGSGSSGNLLVAKKFVDAYANLPSDADARSILFMWFCAEESGLVGSRFYVKHPITDIKKHTIMLNMDMIGRLRDGKFELGGVATADGLKNWLAPYIGSSGMKIKQSNSGYGPSDHASFTGVQVPTLFFFTLLHKEYHSPADIIETINFEGAVQVADLAFRISLDAAQKPDGFKFSDGDAKSDDETAVATAAKDPAKDGKKDDQPAVAGVADVGVRFGIQPGDYSGEEKGVLIGEVFPDLPAAKAGLKKGDLMTKWNDTNLTDVAGWMPMLSKAKPGDVVTIVYKREVDGEMKELTTQATLIARAGRGPQ